jgi:hypothetical protein
MAAAREQREGDLLVQVRWTTTETASHEAPSSSIDANLRQPSFVLISVARASEAS